MHCNISPDALYIGLTDPYKLHLGDFYYATLIQKSMKNLRKKLVFDEVYLEGNPAFASDNAWRGYPKTR